VCPTTSVSSTSLSPDAISEDAYAEDLRCFKDSARMHAMCEDYRAAATIDLEHDRAVLCKKVECPLLALWGGNGAMDTLYDVLATWPGAGGERPRQGAGRRSLSAGAIAAGSVCRVRTVPAG
jgi:hypothetical protein